MGRKNIVTHLNVFLNSSHIGILTKQSSGAITFRYTDEWVENGYKISLSLPLADKFFSGEKASFYFDNLLPDNKSILEAIARKFGAKSIKQFDLLHKIGKECVGALSFFDEAETPHFTKKMRVRSLKEEDIAKRILGLSSDNPLGMDEGDFRLSLGGAQEKMALLKREGKWYEPKGQTPTSHIIKKKMGLLLGGIDFDKSVDNELICLLLAKRFGIKTCNASIETFMTEKILCIERFDREWKDHFLYRIPQEDFCQALGLSPQRKYERDGGPSIQAMMKILETSNNADQDRKMFFKTVMFNDLIYNTDGHAKNFSLFLTRIGFALTPMYDLLSAHFIYPQNQQRSLSLRSSLSVNYKYIYSEISLDDWKIEASKCKLSSSVFQEICEELSLHISQLPALMNDVKKEIDWEQFTLISDGILRRAKSLGI